MERQQLFAAVRAILVALGRQHRFAVVVEDLHWGDSGILDLLEHVVTASGGCGVPLVGTYRTDDAEYSPRAAEWLLRMQQLFAVDVLDLTALFVEETTEQLAMLGHRTPSVELAARIHRRPQGHRCSPNSSRRGLSTHRREGRPCRRRLSDLLDQRLAGISEEAWPVARELGIADRALTEAQLGEVTGLSGSDLAACLHGPGSAPAAGFRRRARRRAATPAPCLGRV